MKGPPFFSCECKEWDVEVAHEPVLWNPSQDGVQFGIEHDCLECFSVMQVKVEHVMVYL